MKHILWKYRNDLFYFENLSNLNRPRKSKLIRFANETYFKGQSRNDSFYSESLSNLNRPIKVSL